MNEIQRKAHKEAIRRLNLMSIEEKEKAFLEKTEGMTDEEIVQEFKFFLGRLWEDDEQS